MYPDKGERDGERITYCQLCTRSKTINHYFTVERLQKSFSIFSSTGVTIGSAETTQSSSSDNSSEVIREARKAGNRTPLTFYPNPGVGIKMRRFGVDAYCTGLRPQLLEILPKVTQGDQYISVIFRNTESARVIGLMSGKAYLIQDRYKFGDDSCMNKYMNNIQERI
ncbi:MAG: hypothetical protein EZS28_006899 [Streblomastix strix]|uniref:Uncharacterized protein n=1 Tax=Streblomastix strix TaxID=222440 RepID=A0A5J4WRM6_9EUKA|nr:MAG: hypothetical protein EZS28_006899 [Streblomastix strix]